MVATFVLILESQFAIIIIEGRVTGDAPGDARTGRRGFGHGSFPVAASNSFQNSRTILFRFPSLRNRLTQNVELMCLEQEPAAGSEDSQASIMYKLPQMSGANLKEACH